MIAKNKINDRREIDIYLQFFPTAKKKTIKIKDISIKISKKKKKFFFYFIYPKSP